MASIVDPMLEIELNQDAERKRYSAVYRVSCKVLFDQTEFCMMKLCPDGYWFGMDSTIWGADRSVGEPTDDNPLFFVPHSWRFPFVFPNGLEASYDAEYRDAVPEYYFNEDYGPRPVGDDEVFARFTLENMFSRSTIATADSPIVHGRFYNRG